jgi:hypothetical protein
MVASSSVALVLGFCGLSLACSSTGSDTSPNPPSGGAGGAAGASMMVAGGGSRPDSVAGTASGGGSAGQASGGGGGGGGAGGMAAGGTAAGGTAGAAGMNGGGAGPCGKGSIFCTDFEEEAIPSAMVFFPEYLRAMQKLVTLDTSVFHGGKRALKVTGTDSSQMLGVTVPSKFWGRVYLRSDTDIQEGHDTYLAAGTGTGDPNDGTYIRIGEHECQLELNRNTDDKELLSNGGQYMCSGGVKFLKDTWYCLEFYYDGPGKEARVFVDGAEVPALHPTDWGPYDYKLLKIGYEKYGGSSKTLWYDDLAIAAEQIHCL